jgi:hypothetical protein
MSLNTDPALSMLIAYAPRITILPFAAAVWFEGRLDFALMLTLLWHFVVAVPWYGLADCDTANVKTAYFIVMPVIAVGFALLGMALRVWLLHLPRHITPLSHALHIIFGTKKADDSRGIPLPGSFLVSSLIVSFLVVVASWLPAELMVYYGFSVTSTSDALFWMAIFLPPGALLLPLALWFFYGKSLKKIFGEKRHMWLKFKAFLKLVVPTAVISTSFALVAAYCVDFLWLWVTAIIVVGGILIFAFAYYVYERDEKSSDYEELVVY